MGKEWRITLYGSVQGVGLRYAVKNAAIKLGLKGYAQNLAGGSVQVILQGEEIIAKTFIKQLPKACPNAKISEIVVQENKIAEIFDNFEIVY